MISLYDIDLLVNDIFYRSEHILSYIETHELTALDKEAIINTILYELSYYNIIDPKKQSLDLNTMSICDNLKHSTLINTPFVLGIPSHIKEQLRYQPIYLSGGLPASTMIARPASNLHYCLYDMNTAFSIAFDNFKFLECNYDSPTRPGVRVEKRPFIEVKIDGVNYLADLLTKRLFRKDVFIAKYKLEVLKELSNDNFNDEQTMLYLEQTELDNNRIGEMLLFTASLNESFRGVPKFSEYLYEFEKVKELYPEAVVESKKLEEDLKFFKGLL